MDPVSMYERAAFTAADMALNVTSEQRQLPTPCKEWDVAALLEHMAGGAVYLMEAAGALSEGPPWPDAAVVKGVLEALRRPGALQERCMSPAGFEWSLAEATAGTAMDQLIHTWDLAVAIGRDRHLDPQLVEAVVAMMLPQMPEIGRKAGLVGPEVPVPAEASAQDRLLGAMGRNPEL
jgi:uncharacterized protein (TIGR03086 family)